MTLTTDMAGGLQVADWATHREVQTPRKPII